MASDCFSSWSLHTLYSYVAVIKLELNPIDNLFAFYGSKPFYHFIWREINVINHKPLTLYYLTTLSETHQSYIAIYVYYRC